MSHIDRQSADFDPLRNPDLFGVAAPANELPEASKVDVVEERVVDETVEVDNNTQSKGSDLFANVNVGKVTDLFGDMSVEPVIIPKKKKKAVVVDEEDEEDEEPVADAAPVQSNEDDMFADTEYESLFLSALLFSFSYPLQHV